jgi:hypothetical protein
VESPSRGRSRLSGQDPLHPRPHVAFPRPQNPTHQ